MLRIRDVYPGSRILIFTHPGSRIHKQLPTKERGEKKFLVINFYLVTNFTKCKIVIFLNCCRKNFGPRIIELFTQKVVTKLSKIWVWDPGSGINLFRIPDPGVKKAQDPGSATLGKRTATRVQYWSGIKKGRRKKRMLTAWPTNLQASQAVLGIRDILVRIRIPGSGSDSFLFWPQAHCLQS